MSMAANGILWVIHDSDSLFPDSTNVNFWNDQRGKKKNAKNMSKNVRSMVLQSASRSVYFFFLPEKE